MWRLLWQYLATFSLLFCTDLHRPLTAGYNFVRSCISVPGTVCILYRNQRIVIVHGIQYTPSLIFGWGRLFVGYACIYTNRQIQMIFQSFGLQERTGCDAIHWSSSHNTFSVDVVERCTIGGFFIMMEILWLWLKPERNTSSCQLVSAGLFTS